MVMGSHGIKSSTHPLCPRSLQMVFALFGFYIAPVSEFVVLLVCAIMAAKLKKVCSSLSNGFSNLKLWIYTNNPSEYADQQREFEISFCD